MLQSSKVAERVADSNSGVAGSSFAGEVENSLAGFLEARTAVAAEAGSSMTVAGEVVGEVVGEVAGETVPIGCFDWIEVVGSIDWADPRQEVAGSTAETVVV